MSGNNKYTGYLFLLLTALSLMACRSSPDLDVPPEIIYGQDVCDECSMIINEARFAASYVTADGNVHRFDDIGNMLLYDHKHQDNVHVYWVHDFHTEDWIDVEVATLVLNSELVTPMAWSLAAFADKAEAEAYVAEFGGTLSSFASLQQAVAEGAIEPALLYSHVHGHDDGPEADMGADMEMEGHEHMGQ